MEMNGTRQIAAPREVVWAALNDPEVLKSAIPGCEELTGSPEDGFEARVKQKVGPVSATFQGRVQLSDIVPLDQLHHLRRGQGRRGRLRQGLRGGGARRQRGRHAPHLPGQRANVGGKLAQLGSRLIDGFAKKMADSFFDNFRAAVEPAAEPVDGEAAATDKQPGWFRRMIGRKG